MALMRTLILALLAAPLSIFATNALGAENADLEAGSVMYRQCALCHGAHGQGILGGKYPRIAGMPHYYLMNSLMDYQGGTRDYSAMNVVGGLQTASEQDLINLAAYISELQANIDVPGPEAGDIRSGKGLYKSDCRTCHGRNAEGQERKESPPLVGQYHEYLLSQIDLFNAKQRIHANDPDDETFKAYSDEELLDILAFIASLDDQK